MNNIKRHSQPWQKDINSLIEQIFKVQEGDASFVDTGTWAPAVDIREDNERFVVIADIPGVNKEDIHISLENNLLTLHGERLFEKKENRKGYSRMERAQGQFYRRFSLPQTADEAQISAKYHQGVLEIIIPKKEENLKKKIEVMTGE